uniref:Candidate secreted effector n=1 Tax=Meloidogyne incognita TaxID=6306 RepID=A0A914LN74_MELIC
MFFFFVFSKYSFTYCFVWCRQCFVYSKFGNITSFFCFFIWSIFNNYLASYLVTIYWRFKL